MKTGRYVCSQQQVESCSRRDMTAVLHDIKAKSLISQDVPMPLPSNFDAGSSHWGLQVHLLCDNPLNAPRGGTLLVHKADDKQF